MFDFECTKCGHAFEDLVPADAKPPCPECGGATEKVLSVGAGIVRKKGSKAEFFTHKDNQAKLRADNKKKGIEYKP